MKTEKERVQPSILLFDGHCNLCSFFVRFVIPRDPRRNFKFASLQSEEARRLLESVNGVYLLSGLDTFIMVEDGRTYVKSSAALRVIRKLKGLWPLLYGLIIFPKSVRDAVYDWVAANRYRWFGRTQQCLVPSPEIKSRFLEAGEGSSLSPNPTRGD